MSKYKTIQTEFRNFQSLIAALTAMGYENKIEVSKNISENSLQMYGFQGDLRPEQCAIRIPRNFVGMSSNDVGFYWDGKTYQAVISDYDSKCTWNIAKLNNLRQEYARHEVKRQAKAKGYTVNEIRQPDNTIRIQLVKR